MDPKKWEIGTWLQVAGAAVGSLWWLSAMYWRLAQVAKVATSVAAKVEKHEEADARQFCEHAEVLADHETRISVNETKTQAHNDQISSLAANIRSRRAGGK